MLQVDEAGTEAERPAALLTAEALGPSTNITFNKPFLILISDKETSTTLFMGKIVDPTKK